MPSETRSRVRKSRLVLPAVAASAAAAFAFRRYRGRSPRPGAAYLAGAPLLIAHRGGSGLAPENTIYALRRAVEWWGADILEIDVQPTADGEVVVFHDDTLDRTTDHTGPVAARTLAELRQVDAAYRFTPDGGEGYPLRGRGIGIPTLAELLEALPDVRINIEIKDGRAQQATRAALLEANALGRVLIAAGSSPDRSLFRDLPVATSAGQQELRPFVLQLMVGLSFYTPAVDALQLPDRWEGREVLTPRLVRVAHEKNLAVHVWTVDDPEDMARYLEWGVDGIISDRPDLLARVLHERFGRPLPPGPPGGHLEY